MHYLSHKKLVKLKYIVTLNCDNYNNGIFDITREI